MTVLHGALGLLGLLGVAWLLSENRWQIPLRVVIGGVALQIALALLFIKFPPATSVFLLLNDGVASLLLYWGVLQRIVGALAFALRRTLGIGGALALGGAVHIFVGMVEAPLLVRPYLN